MATGEAEAVMQRRGWIERTNAQTTRRRLGAMLVRGLRKVQVVAMLRVIAHNLATAWRLRAATTAVA